LAPSSFVRLLFLFLFLFSYQICEFGKQILESCVHFPFSNKRASNQCGMGEMVEEFNQGGKEMDTVPCKAVAPPSLCCLVTLTHGRLSVLQWAHANGCPRDKWTSATAAKGGHLEAKV